MPIGSRLRILLIVSGFPTPERPDRGIFNARTARELSRHADVHVLFLRTWTPARPILKREVTDGVEVTCLALPPIVTSLRLRSRLFAAVANRLFSHVLKDMDIIHSVDTSIPVGVASLLAQRYRKPLVVQIVSMMSFDDPRLRKTFSSFASTADRFVCNSQALQDRLNADYRPATPVVTLIRGTDTTHFQPSYNSLTASSNRWTGLRFLYLGGIPNYSVPNIKGEQTLMAAWQLAETELASNGVELWFGGPGSNGAQAQQWKAQLKHNTKVCLLGAISPKKLPDVYNSCDAVVIPSTSEGLPNVALEAGACGKPVIASGLPAIAEVVRHGVTGLLFTPGSTAELARLLVSTSNQPHLLARMGMTAREHIVANHSLITYVDRLLQEYHLTIIDYENRHAATSH